MRLRCCRMIEDSMSPSAPYFDLQVNGFARVDFQQDDLSPVMLELAVSGLLSHGTGSFHAVVEILLHAGPFKYLSGS